MFPEGTLERAVGPLHGDVAHVLQAMLDNCVMFSGIQFCFPWMKSCRFQLLRANLKY